MRSFTLFAVLALMSGCTDGRTSREGGTDVGGASTASVGHVRQAAQFSDNTVINLVDPGLAMVTVTADVDPATVDIFYVGDKTTDAGTTATGPQLVDTLTLGPDQTGTHLVRLGNAAFRGGYGSIFLKSRDDPPSIFQTYVEYGSSLFSVGGSVFQGGRYRIPYLAGTLRVVLVVTNQGVDPCDVQFLNLANAQSKTITLPISSTFRFDSVGAGWTLPGTNAIEIITSGGGVLALSGYEDHLLQRVRLTPVKAAPFP